MMIFDGLIIAAGKQTRFENDIPKPLMCINGEAIIDKNINIMKKHTDKIFVICSHENEEYFNNHKWKHEITLIPIESGFGCGDAVLKSLNILKESENIIMTWGDVIINDDIIYEKTIKYYDGKFTIPLRYEQSPYVKFFIYNNEIISIKFKKYDGEQKRGYHDLSFFAFNKEHLKIFLTKLYNLYYNNNRNNFNCRNGELIYLDLFNNYKFEHKIIYMNDVDVKSFNTIEEYNKCTI